MLPGSSRSPGARVSETRPPRLYAGAQGSCRQLGKVSYPTPTLLDFIQRTESHALFPLPRYIVSVLLITVLLAGCRVLISETPGDAPGQLCPVTNASKALHSPTFTRILTYVVTSFASPFSLLNKYFHVQSNCRHWYCQYLPFS